MVCGNFTFVANHAKDAVVFGSFNDKGTWPDPLVNLDRKRC